MIDAQGCKAVSDAEQITSLLVSHLVDSVDNARGVEHPFFHLEFDQVFPPSLYERMMNRKPDLSDYRPYRGRRDVNVLPDGTCTRHKLDLFPESVRRLPPDKRVVWAAVGRALSSKSVEAAFRRRLAEGLRRRFGNSSLDVKMYPVPTLIRDRTGYRIRPHTDSEGKGITVQLYLPPDALHSHVGTVFHEILPNGLLPKSSRMKFAPNSGYAFAVGDDTWHSADPVGPQVPARDSILLTYFVDAGVLRFLGNRGKRIGNLLLDQVRRLNANS
jgi:hypothetical protein